tara:strand:- start:219 stop:2183 length:1965 start_codon:yes stop_codon:yes gene_type:complete
VILENLIVNNFGVYSGKQSFDLTTDKKKPVILIGAMNGSGKTTFLHAIDFVLYGKFSNIFQSQKLSYENFLKKNINKSNFDSGAQIELTFFRKFKGKNEKFKLSRNLKPNGSKIKEEFFVFINDVYDEDITKDWDNFVDQILPSRVASLFFFDGEKIEQLADLDKSKEVLKKAINSLLGLEIVDQLNIDVDEFQKRSLVQLKTDEEREKIDQLNSKIEDLENNIKKTDEKIVLEEDRLTKTKYDISQLDISLSQKGLSYYEKKKEYEKETETISLKKDSIKNELVKLAAGDAPLSIVKDQIKDILEQSKNISQIKNKSEFQKNTNELLHNINDFVKTKSKEAEFIKDFEKFIESKKIIDNKKENNEYLLKNLNYEDLNLLLNQNLVSEENEIIKNTNLKKKLDEEFEKILQLINKIPSDDEIKPLIKEQKKLNEDQLKLKTKINVLNQQRSEQNGPLIKLNIQLKQELEKKSNQDLINLDKKRFVDYSVKVKDILTSFHVKALDFHIKRLEKMILESFNNLHRKKDFVKSIKIDTSSFDLKVYEKKNNEIDTNKLSAGERQLLAVAILWGLAKASKSSAPTIIDTPLGRLDSDHRINLVDKYFPTASKQVILLSTDEEINQKYHKRIKPFLTRSYKIEYDQSINGSKLYEGYFF